MEEIWKPIPGYEGRYEVSSLGRFRSYAQDAKEGKIKTGHTNHKGYLVILLYDGQGNKKWYPIHRLVAMTFLPNPEHLEQVNHKDENKKNNCVDNLEWCTNDYNVHYGTGYERAAMANRCCETTSRKVCSIAPNGEVKQYASIGEAERQTGIHHSNIVRTLKGRSHSSGGYEWQYC